MRTRFASRGCSPPLGKGQQAFAARVIALNDDAAVYDEVRREAWGVLAGSLSYDHTTDAFLEALR